jgi:hypothetical protein
MDVEGSLSLGGAGSAGTTDFSSVSSSGLSMPTSPTISLPLKKSDKSCHLLNKKGKKGITVKTGQAQPQKKEETKDHVGGNGRRLQVGRLLPGNPWDHPHHEQQATPEQSTTPPEYQDPRNKTVQQDNRQPQAKQNCQTEPQQQKHSSANSPGARPGRNRDLKITNQRNQILATPRRLPERAQQIKDRNINWNPDRGQGRKGSTILKHTGCLQQRDIFKNKLCKVIKHSSISPFPDSPPESEENAKLSSFLFLGVWVGQISLWVGIL